MNQYFFGFVVLVFALTGTVESAQTTARGHFDNANQIFLSAPDVVEYDQLNKAISELENAVELDPTFLDALMLLGKAYDQKRMVWELDEKIISELKSRANKIYRQAAALKPRDPQIRYRLVGKIGGSYEEQIEMIKEIIVSDPDYAPARKSYSHYLEAKGEIEQAVGELRAFIEHGEAGQIDYRDYFRLADLLLKLGRQEEAVDTLDEFISKTPPHIAFYRIDQFNLASLEESGFANFVSKVEKLKNYNNSSHIDDAYQLLNSNQLGEAMNAFYEHIAINPFNSNHYREFAEKLHQKGHYREAYAVYETLLDSDNQINEKCWRFGGIFLRREFASEEGSLVNKFKTICNTKVKFIE